MDGASLTLRNSTITQGFGVGLNVYTGMVTVTGNTISQMRSGSQAIGSFTYSYYGYGVYSNGSTTTLTANTITGNGSSGV
ncbi:MAG TPA: hypothetical protein VGD69_05635, partial [Herpetosiphonaceae bacterium]